MLDHQLNKWEEDGKTIFEVLHRILEKSCVGINTASVHFQVTYADDPPFKISVAKWIESSSRPYFGKAQYWHHYRFNTLREMVNWVERKRILLQPSVRLD